MITIFKNLFDKTPHYITLENALNRIKTGKSQEKIDEIRNAIDKERADGLKRNLPSVCFSGKFQERTDGGLLEHSGYMVLDFDEVDDVSEKKAELSKLEYVYAVWVSPRNNGVKALVRIADGSKHREHFESIKELHPDVDNSGINVSRVCFESYDPEIYINEKAVVFKKYKKREVVKVEESVTDYGTIYNTLNVWLSNKGDAFRTGERNTFVYKLASACCRYGIPEINAVSMIAGMYAIGNSSFSEQECKQAILSAYKSPRNEFASATISKGVLVNRSNNAEVDLPRGDDFYDPSVKAKDVMYGEDVKDKALEIFRNGREDVMAWDIPILDKHFKRRRRELTLLTGIGNYGKGIWNKYLMLLRAIKFDEKWAVFAPEDNPAEEFYNELAEMMLGGTIDPKFRKGISEAKFEWAYDFISKHFFFIDPQTISPTPDYIKEKFLELIVKEKIDGCVIDPFNQMANDYSKTGGRDDKYLETFLSDVLRFAQINNVFMDIVSHPKQLHKNGDKNYPTPDVFDLAGGAMWNNKADNIMVYHRPNHQEDPNDPTAEISFKKIKKQKITGVKGSFLCQYNVVSRRFEFDGYDPIAAEIERRFNVTQAEIPMNIEKSNKIRENTNFLNKTKDEYSDYEQFDAPKGEAPF
jgi:hypothetical protein